MNPEDSNEDQIGSESPNVDKAKPEKKQSLAVKEDNIEFVGDTKSDEIEPKPETESESKGQPPVHGMPSMLMFKSPRNEDSKHILNAK